MPQGSIALTCHPLRAGSFIHKCLLNIYFMPDIMLGGSGDTKKKKENAVQPSGNSQFFDK